MLIDSLTISSDLGSRLNQIPLMFIQSPSKFRELISIWMISIFNKILRTTWILYDFEYSLPTNNIQGWVHSLIIQIKSLSIFLWIVLWTFCPCFVFLSGIKKVRLMSAKHQIFIKISTLKIFLRWTFYGSVLLSKVPQ